MIHIKNKKKLAVICGVVAGVCALGILGGFFALNSYVGKAAENKVLDGIYIGEVDVSGLSKGEAEKELNAWFEKSARKPVTLRVGDKTVDVQPDELGVSLKEPEKAVEHAMEYGKKGNVLKRYQKMKELSKKKKLVLEQPQYDLDEKKVNEVFEAKCKPLEEGAKDATIARVNGAFQITEGQNGHSLNMDKSKETLKTFFRDTWKGEGGEVTLVYETKEPSITKQDLEVIQDELGTFTTYCGTGGGRVQNIETGAKLINGRIIMPGQEFSADKAMRPYTYENGFTEAGSYENGKVVNSMGGGICQVSTTLYNAVLFAELEVTQRQPHSMTVNYVKPSMDAAIAGDVKDLKFKNNTQYPIFIEGYVSGGNLTFTIYGKETRPAGREIRFESETTGTKDGGVKMTEASGQAIGYFSKTDSGHTGKTARLWKIVTVDGKEQSREVINNSSYISTATTYAVGTASASAEASAIVRNAIGTNNKDSVQSAISRAKQIQNEQAAKKEQEKQQENQKKQEQTPPQTGSGEQQPQTEQQERKRE